MGNILSQHYENQNIEQYNTRQRLLHYISVKIADTDPNSPQATDILWMAKNYEKITGNRKLIDLLR